MIVLSKFYFSVFRYYLVSVWKVDSIKFYLFFFLVSQWFLRKNRSNISNFLCSMHIFMCDGYVPCEIKTRYYKLRSFQSCAQKRLTRAKCVVCHCRLMDISVFMIDAFHICFLLVDSSNQKVRYCNDSALISFFLSLENKNLIIRWIRKYSHYIIVQLLKCCDLFNLFCSNLYNKKWLFDMRIKEFEILWNKLMPFVKLILVQGLLWIRTAFCWDHQSTKSLRFKRIQNLSLLWKSSKLSSSIFYSYLEYGAIWLKTDNDFQTDRNSMILI